MHDDRRPGFPALFVLLSILLLSACKKVDDHYTEVTEQPWVTTGEFPLGPNGTNSYNYPKAVLVGDTVSIRGKIFIDDGGYIQMGGVQAVPVVKVKITSADGSLIDQVRFIVTPAMGVGPLPVKVVAKGITINLPSINVRQYAGIPQRTDTTLYVERVAEFTPSDVSLYQPEYLSYLVNSSIDAEGNIWFDNPLGVFRVSDRSVESILKSGSSLHDGGGDFVVNRILGSVISYDGNRLSFSAAVSDNGDTVANYVFRLCQMNVQTGEITLINRTLVSKIPADTDGSPGAFEGPADQLHLVAMSLRTDANNVLYFNNSYTIPSPNNDISFWYNAFVSRGNNPIGQYTIANICSLRPDGNVSSLFSINSTVNPNVNPVFRVPGFPVETTTDYKISQDGSTAYLYDKSDGFAFSLLQFDLGKKIPLHSSGVYANYRFLSYDDDPDSRFTGSSLATFLGFLINQNGDYALQPLPNGTILLGSGASIAALNNLDQTAYAFAGSESGLPGQAAPDQTQYTGPAKNVIFNGAYLVFCGVDKNGTIYYVSSATGNDLTSGPLTFYKIYSKK